MRATTLDPRPAQRGFTLVEMAVVVGIIAVLAVAAVVTVRAQRRNVYLRQAASELAMRAVGLRSTALSQGQTYVLVVVDAKNNDASQCGAFDTSTCARYFILSAPQSSWSLSGFDPGNPGAKAAVAESVVLPPHARFYVQGAYKTPPPPFDKVTVFDSRFFGQCVGGNNCFAIRFTMNGVALPELTGGGAQQPPPPGFAFILASDADLEGRGGDHRGVVVGFPAGVVKTWAY